MKSCTKILLFIFFVTLFGCNKSENPSEPTQTTSGFKAVFESYSNIGNGAIWLHDSNGRNINNLKSFIDEETLDFGQSEGDRINFTSIITRYIGNKKEYYLKTFYNAPKGTWTFSGQDQRNKGDAQIDISFPSDQYSGIFTSIPGSISSGGVLPFGQSASNRTVSFTNIKNINADGTISYYSYIFNSNNNGFCGWSLNKPFNIGVMNNFQLTLTSSLASQTFTSNKQIRSIRIRALMGDTYDELTLYSNYFSSSFKTQILVPNSFPAKKYDINASYADDQQSYSYSRYSNALINDITIPTSSITATLDGDKTYSNISINGKVDEIRATYLYYDVQNDIRYYWDIHTPSNTKEIRLPDLPNELSTLFPDLNFSNFTSSVIALTDFDYAQSFDDIISIYYRGKSFFEFPINEIYTYYMK